MGWLGAYPLFVCFMSTRIWKLYLALFALWGAGASLQGQNVVFKPASIQALGGSVTSLQLPGAFEFNPASIVSSRGEGGLSYSRFYMLTELSASSAYIVFPVSKSAVQFAFTRFGEKAYRENQLSLGIAKHLGQSFSAGVRMQYFNLVMAENDRHPALVTFSLGLLYNRDDFGFGASVFNPLNQSMKESGFERKFPPVFRVGAHRLFNRKLLFVSGVDYQSDTKLNSHWGLECRFSEVFCARAGLETATSTWSLGTGWVFGKLHADLAFSYHQYLGSTPTVTIYLCQP